MGRCLSRRRLQGTMIGEMYGLNMGALGRACSCATCIACKDCKERIGIYSGFYIGGLRERLFHEKQSGLTCFHIQTCLGSQNLSPKADVACMCTVFIGVSSDTSQFCRATTMSQSDNTFQGLEGLGPPHVCNHGNLALTPKLRVPVSVKFQRQRTPNKT